MAVYSSNRITVIEQKKIVGIEEWYLASPYDSNVSIDTEGWTTSIQAIDATKKFLWNYEKVIYSIGDADVSEPVIIGVYGNTGETGSSLQVKYINSKTTPTITNNDVSLWSDVIPTPVAGQKTYMTQKLSTDINWSIPIQISGTDGSTPVMTIIDGYWYVNGESTGVKAQGNAPEITVGDNGNWVIDGVDTGTKAQGEAGKDGADIEYVYYRSETSQTLSPPFYVGDKLTSGWTPSPQGITEVYQYEYMSVRTKPSGINTSWTNFSTPVIWSKWGEKGQDGDGIEYRYYLSNSSEIPSYTVGDSKWTDDPTGVTLDDQYEYVVQIKMVDGQPIASKPALWAKYGEDGVGIDGIENYYAISTTPDEAPTEWTTSLNEAGALSVENKYLWNYELIYYTDGTKFSTDPAIIGVYGDSGADAVTFGISSAKGLFFKEDLRSIELKSFAFEGGSHVITDAEFKWWYLDDETNEYLQIEDVTGTSLEVHSTDSYAYKSIKATMFYNGTIYEDYVVLAEQTVIYTTTVKFFDGTNIFYAEDPYVVAYLNTYRNNTLVETISADSYCKGISTLNTDTNIITPSGQLEGEFKDGDKLYFIIAVMSEDIVMYYDAILGQYDGTNWNKMSNTMNYTYQNSLHANDTDNILVISKEEVNKSLSVDFVVLLDGKEISNANVIVIDSNDPIISSTAPDNPVFGQLWLDTSVPPYILKIYKQKEGTENGEWVSCSETIGGAIFTSKPSSYRSGDLWILGDGEICISNGVTYGSGSMLKAIKTSNSFSDDDWVDADADTTQLRQNIKQYFIFDADNGLKIGQRDEKFYVKISSTEMGFYDNSNSNNPHQKVVSISKNSADINNLTVGGSDGGSEKATFNCNTFFNNEINLFDTLVLKKESDGSISLAVAK